MSRYVMTYRTADGLRMQTMLAASMAQAWDCAFEVLERMGCTACGCGVRRISKQGASA